MRALAFLLILISGSALAEERVPLIDMNPPYVQVVVTACPRTETPLEPINQGKIYDNERSMTREERTAYFRDIGCIEVPIPAEVLTQELSYRQCIGPAGYLASMRPWSAPLPWDNGPASPVAARLPGWRINNPHQALSRVRLGGSPNARP